MKAWSARPGEEGASMAALIRRYVRERLMPLPSIEEDPLWDIVGLVEGDSDDSARVNDVVYPLRPAP